MSRPESKRPMMPPRARTTTQASRVVDDEGAVAGNLLHGGRPGGEAEADCEHDEYEAPHGLRSVSPSLG